MPTGPELLRQSQEDEQRRKAATSPPSGIPNPETDEIQRIKNETARITAETEKRKAEWELAAQSAGYVSVDDYKKALDELRKEQTSWIHQKALDNSEIEKTKAELTQQKEQLRQVKAALDTRDQNVTKRESLCAVREEGLGTAQKVEYDRREQYNSDLEVLKRNGMFIRNRLVRVANQLTSLNAPTLVC